MGKIKYNIEEFIKKTPIFDINSLKKLSNDKYVYLLLNKLLKKGKIKRLTRGYYTIHDDPSLLVFCFKQAYLGLQDAMSLHNLWEQETIPIIITTQKVRTGLRNVNGNNVLIKRIDKTLFFGFDYYKQGEFYLPYSDKEKTVIDMAYFKQNFKINKKLDKKKLEEYLKKYSKEFRDEFYNFTKLK
ncbi:hypothetical protein J4436_02980 [Candidatus Woesearchaeota archaeon]|nr:hypothetical protein [Candidatus Woesearchaeota archaeon]